MPRPLAPTPDTITPQAPPERPAAPSPCEAPDCPPPSIAPTPPERYMPGEHPRDVPEFDT